MAAIAARAHLPERTAQRAATHTACHGWWERTVTPGESRKVTGQVTIGKDCDCRAWVTCLWCGKPLADDTATTPGSARPGAAWPPAVPAASTPQVDLW